MTTIKYRTGLIMHIIAQLYVWPVVLLVVLILQDIDFVPILHELIDNFQDTILGILIFFFIIILLFFPYIFLIVSVWVTTGIIAFGPFEFYNETNERQCRDDNPEIRARGG